jgi:peptidoglycan L-alanyl-D-glutamate endopeptidase CwlK
MNIENMIGAIQSELHIGVDGRAGPETWSAIYRRIVPAPKPAATPAAGVAAMAIDKVDPRSEETIATLLANVQPYARALVHKAAAAGIMVKVISGLRTFAEQEALYAQGRTTKGKIVTNARGGHSNHNFGIAFDIGVFDGTRYLDESPLYAAVGVLGMELGLEWGGSWKTIHDEPHYQLRPTWAAGLSEGDMLAQLRDRKEMGQEYFA